MRNNSAAWVDEAVPHFRDVTGPIHLPKTGNWQKWQTVTVQGVKLPRGRGVIGVVFDKAPSGDGGHVCNLNWVRLRKADQAEEQRDEPKE